MLLQQEADLKQPRLPGQVRFGIWDGIFSVFGIWYLDDFSYGVFSICDRVFGICDHVFGICDHVCVMCDFVFSIWYVAFYCTTACFVL